MADEIPAQHPLVERYREIGINQLTSGWSVREDTVISVINPLMDRAVAQNVTPESFQTFIALSGDSVTQTEEQDEDKYDYIAFVPSANTEADGLRARVAAGISGWGVLPDGQAFVTPDQSRAIQAALVEAAKDGDLDDEQLKEVVKAALEPKDAEEESDDAEVNQEELEEVQMSDASGSGEERDTDQEVGAAVVQVDQKNQPISADNSQGEANNDLLTQAEVDSAMVTGATTEQTIEELMQQDANVQNAYNEVVGRLGYTSAQIEAMTPEELAQKMETEVEAVNLRYRSDTHDSNVAYLRNVPAYARALALQSAREDISTGYNAASDEVMTKVEAAGEDEPEGQEPDTNNEEDGNQPTLPPEIALTELIDGEPVEPGTLADKLALSLMKGTYWQIGPEGQLIGAFTHPTVLKPVNDILAQIRTSGIDWNVTQVNGRITFTPAENHHFVSVTYNPEDGVMDIERRNWTAQEAAQSLQKFTEAISDPDKMIEEALSGCFLLDMPVAEHIKETDEAINLLVDRVVLPQEDGSQNPDAILMARGLMTLAGQEPGFRVRYSADNALQEINNVWGPVMGVVKQAHESGGFADLSEDDMKLFIQGTGILLGAAAYLPHADVRDVDSRNPQGTIPMREAYAKMLRPLVQNLFVGNSGIASRLSQAIGEVRAADSARAASEAEKKAQAERDRQVEEEEALRKPNSPKGRLQGILSSLMKKNN